MPKRLVSLGALLRAGNPAISVLLHRLGEHDEILERVLRALPQSTRPHCLSVVPRGQELILYADSPAWASRLQFLKNAVTSILAADLAGNYTRIRIKVIPEVLCGRRPQNRRSPVAITEQSRRAIASAAEGIADAKLQTAL